MPDQPLRPGTIEQVAPYVRRLIAPNPGIMTGPGTNTYLVGDGELVVIDPGPADVPGHVDALVEAVGDRCRAVLVTHTHLDHSPAAAAFAERTGSERLGYASRDDFVADRTLADGDVIDLGPVVLQALHTPGHASNHLCYLATWPGGERDSMLFSGDHVMGGSTVVIAPLDGDMAQYLSSLERLLDVAPPIGAIAPGHGPVLEDPRAVVEGYVAHRLAREAAIVDALRRAGSARVDQLVAEVYADVDAERHPIARRSVWAHLRKLTAEGLVSGDDPDDVETRWHYPHAPSPPPSVAPGTEGSVGEELAATTGGTNDG